MLHLCVAFTTHLGMAGDFNEVHPCARLEFDQWTLGAYRNSETTLSVYGSYTFELGNLFAEVGAVAGYSGAAVLPFARAGIEFDETRLFIAPAYTNGGDIGLVVGVEVPLEF